MERLYLVQAFTFLGSLAIGMLLGRRCKPGQAYVIFGLFCVFGLMLAVLETPIFDICLVYDLVTPNPTWYGCLLP